MPDPIVFRGLTEEQANATATFQRNNGGTAEIIADGTGHFSVKVTFPEAAAGESLGTGGAAATGNFFKDSVSKDPRFRSLKPVGDMNLLEPVTRQLVENIISDAAAHGVKLMVFETYRSQERQVELFNQGATKLRNVGVHHYGLACDIVKDVNGQPSWKGDFSLLGQLAHKFGLIWGGDWGNPNISHSFIDEVHVQRCTISRQPSLFGGTWYPDATYNPYRDG